MAFHQPPGLGRGQVPNELGFDKIKKTGYNKYMSRFPRLLLSKSCYHIITRGNNKNIVFRTPADYDYYLQLIDRFKFELPFNLFHYCLMLNHIHLMVQTNEAEDFWFNGQKVLVF